MRLQVEVKREDEDPLRHMAVDAHLAVRELASVLLHLKIQELASRQLEGRETAVEVA
jgi:hypothetical protein